MKKIFLLFCISVLLCLVSFSQKEEFADFNGDGKVDKIAYKIKDDVHHICDILIYLGTVSSYNSTPITIPDMDYGYPSYPYRFTDVNGDGMADFVTYRGGGKDKDGNSAPIVQINYFSTGATLDIKHKSETSFPSIDVTGSLDPTNHDPKRNFQRNMPSYVYCGNSPESWVRGNALLDQSSGILFITVQLETDATNAGPKGQITAVLKDCNGNSLANTTTDEIGTGGKSPGSAAIRTFSSRVKIDPKIASKVCSIYVTAQCTGSVDRWLNVQWSQIEDAFKIAVTYFSGQ